MPPFRIDPQDQLLASSLNLLEALEQVHGGSRRRGGRIGAGVHIIEFGLVRREVLRAPRAVGALLLEEAAEALELEAGGGLRGHFAVVSR